MPDGPITEKTEIGPYVLGEREGGMTLEKINAMPPRQKSIFLQNIDTINLHIGALSDSFDDDMIGSTPLKLNGKSVTMNKVVEMGKSLPDQKKIELVQKVMNENVTYTDPELDPFIKRRPTAPLQEIGDYAQTTRETLESGIGDCEDWAIAETDLLVKMGIPPQNLQIMSGTVYNTNDDTQFDHANLAVKTSDGAWNVMDINQGKSFVAPQSYLDKGMGGYYFVPDISISAEGTISQFKLSKDPALLNSPTPKQGFTSSAAEYGLDDDNNRKLTSETAFNRAASGEADAPNQDRELIATPALQQKAVQNTPSYLSNGTNGP